MFRHQSTAHEPGHVTYYWWLQHAKDAFPDRVGYPFSMAFNQRLMLVTVVRIAVSTNCDTTVNSNQGCGTQFSAPSSYGSGFNAAGGGWYVIQKSASEGINVWFWSRWDPTVPYGVCRVGSSIEPDASWGPPAATFPVGPSCDYASHFNAHMIIFDLTFCVSLFSLSLA